VLGRCVVVGFRADAFDAAFNDDPHVPGVVDGRGIRLEEVGHEVLSLEVSVGDGGLYAEE
jgi:hypothetical protein